VRHVKAVMGITFDKCPRISEERMLSIAEARGIFVRGGVSVGSFTLA
jgi:hypothetical protein